MAQYWYLGTRMKVSSTDSNNRMRENEYALYVNQVFESAEKAAAAAPARMVKHPGIAYFIQGFEKKLVIDDKGHFIKYEDIKEGLR